MHQIWAARENPFLQSPAVPASITVTLITGIAVTVRPFGMIQAGDFSNLNAAASAVGWLERMLLGSFATTIAVIAVATVGFLMLAGRIDVRRGAQVVLGCFIIFGASTIASGIMGAVSGGGADPALAQTLPPPPPPPLPPPTASQPGSSSPFDPYAGAAAPTQ